MSANAAESMMAPPLTATISPAAIAWRAKSPRPSIRLVRSSTFGLNQLLMTDRPAHRDVADAGPRVEPRPQRPECAVVRGHRAPGESERRHQESAALVKHALLDHLVCSPQYRLRDRQAERLGRLEV